MLANQTCDSSVVFDALLFSFESGLGEVCTESLDNDLLEFWSEPSFLLSSFIGFKHVTSGQSKHSKYR